MTPWGLARLTASMVRVKGSLSLGVCVMVIRHHHRKRPPPSALVLPATCALSLVSANNALNLR